MPTIPIIESKVREVVEHFEWYVTLTDALKEATNIILRQALLDVAQQVRLDTLEEVEKDFNVLVPMAKGYAHEHDVGRNKEMIAEVEAHIASLKQQPL